MTEKIDFYHEKGKYGELSNFYALSKPLMYNGKAYATSEHLYQAKKFIYDGASAASLEYADVIRQAKTPYMAKLYANQTVLKQFPWQVKISVAIEQSLQNGVKRDQDWESKKDRIMEQILLLKFSQCSHCATVLLQTGTALLSEHTTRDSYWGDGGPQRKGRNMLGCLLMATRLKLQNSASESSEQKNKKAKTF